LAEFAKKEAAQSVAGGKKKGSLLYGLAESASDRGDLQKRKGWRKGRGGGGRKGVLDEHLSKERGTSGRPTTGTLKGKGKEMKSCPESFL